MLFSCNAFSQDVYAINIDQNSLVVNSNEASFSFNYSYINAFSSVNVIYAVGVVWSDQDKYYDFHFGEGQWPNNFILPTKQMKFSSGLSRALGETITIGDGGLCNNIPNSQTALLKPNSTYYARAFIFYTNRSFEGGAKKVVYSTPIHFTTQSLPNISNNTISSGGPVICGTITAATFTGSAPQGAPSSATYTYQWQCSQGISGTFTNVPLGANGDLGTNQNYTAVVPTVTVPTQIYYQRIASYSMPTYSNVVRSTSNQTYYTYISNKQQVTVSLSSILSTSLNFQANPIPSITDVNCQWQQSATYNNNYANANGTFTNSSYAITDISKFYNVILTPSGVGCLSYTSTPIGFTSADGDGNYYPYVQITNTTTANTQNWMINNLTTTSMFNTTTSTISIATTTIKSVWTATTVPEYCWYNWNPNNQNYGALYNVYTITSSYSVCPLGWHVATSADWDNLAIAVGGKAIAGNSLASTMGWINPTSPFTPTNQYNFNGLPGGFISAGSFSSIGTIAAWWEAAPNNLTDDRYINNNKSNLNDRGGAGVGDGMYIRCVKNP